ncbi:MAG: NlpC/P60 family protein [Pasteurellaceae bacterium]|nr:NlpC/P60 family protein [Pasteurellaceae bacterium]
MMKKLLLISVALLLAACSSSTRHQTALKNDQQQLDHFIGNLKTNQPQQVIANASYNSTHFVHAPINNKKLSKIYQEWVGTRYRLGGDSHRGIDCSAFMQETFAAVYGIELPRSTSEQRYLGSQIHKSELKQGDLVFFRGNRHVGVYIGNNQFMHSSSSQGVTISSLDESYWARTYTQSRRIL